MESQASQAFSIIIPTYQEAGNISALVTRIGNVNFGESPFEVLLVDDDSQDGTEGVVQNLVKSYPWLTLINRKGPRDLSQSIILGFKQARYPILVTMDADLSHPIERLPKMLSLLLKPNIDMVVGSRYVQGGSNDMRWPLIRRAISRTAAWSARMALNLKVQDPLSGFIAFRKSLLNEGDPLNPIGWKIGLEIMIKCRCKHIMEVPIHFSERERGHSKLTMRISMEYIQHIFALMKYKFFHLADRQPK